MALKHTMKAWDEDEVKLMSFYEWDLKHPEIGLPKFGSDIRVDELKDARIEAFQEAMGDRGGYAFSRRGKKYRETSTFPTILNWAWHFRYMAGELEPLRMVSEQYPGPTANFTRLLLQTGEDKFFHEHVGPLREYLEWKWQVYFYCIPATSYETQLVGGKGGFRPDGPLVLCLIPKFPRVALDRGEQETKVRLFAGPVLWLVRSHLCVNHKLTEEERQDLNKVILAWRDYVTPYHLLGELEKMEKNNPSFLTEESRRTLLPEAALDLLRLPEPPRKDESV